VCQITILSFDEKVCYSIEIYRGIKLELGLDIGYTEYSIGLFFWHFIGIYV